MKLNFKIELFNYRGYFFVSVVVGHSQNQNISSNQWTATDGLGRKLPDATTLTGDSQKRQVYCHFLLDLAPGRR